MTPTFPIIIPENSRLYAMLHKWANELRILFFAGLPGVGKSLLLHQTTHIAYTAGRRAHLMQWDVCRQPFETDTAVRARYPETDGVTHAVVRKAVGLWARDAVAAWRRRYEDTAHILIGEVPLVGSRLIELARTEEDEAEALLRSEQTQFVIAVPSVEVRRHIEGQREARSARPQHEREQADARPHVMRASWAELHAAARRMRIDGAHSQDTSPPYDPDIYHDAYAALLKHRRHARLSIDSQLPASSLSAYDLAIQESELAPSPEDVRRYVREVERRYPDAQTLERDIEKWYVV